MNTKRPFDYSFHCSICGYTATNHEKETIRMIRENHRYVTNPFTKEKMCYMKNIEANHWCRPDLWSHLKGIHNEFK